jgi:hypothetical protein
VKSIWFCILILVHCSKWPTAALTLNIHFGASYLPAISNREQQKSAKQFADFFILKNILLKFHKIISKNIFLIKKIKILF